MGRPAHRTLAWALAVSLLLHFLVVAPTARFWLPPPATLDFPIEARLEPLAAKPTPARTAPPRQKKPASRPRPVVTPPPVSSPAKPSTEAPAQLPVEEVKPADMAGAPPAASPQSAAQQPVPAPSRPAVRDLPTDLAINYAVQLGDGDNGFVAGRATYIWHSGKGRYSMVSTVQATGLASLFISGRIVQVSQGQLDDGGLKPEQYWLERTGRKQDSARFNWSTNQLILAGDEPSQPLKPQAQDLLSFPFQLAMTVRPEETSFVLWVTNGRKFRDYTFHVVGLENVNLQAGQVSALHLQGEREGEGSLDVWLDLEKSGLPVRIRTQDTKGKTMVLKLEGVTVPSGAVSSG